MIIKSATGDQIEEVRKIFREYEAWLGVDLCFQSFEEELNNLPGKYAAPSGRLFLASDDENIVGCVALRKFDERSGEMKRLFVREAFRGSGAGRKLIETLISEAKAIGYKRILLDTLPAKMPKAVALYEFYGFRKISAYYENPHETTLFMEKEL